MAMLPAPVAVLPAPLAVLLAPLAVLLSPVAVLLSLLAKLLTPLAVLLSPLAMLPGPTETLLKPVALPPSNEPGHAGVAGSSRAAAKAAANGFSVRYGVVCDVFICYLHAVCESEKRNNSCYCHQGIATVRLPHPR